MVLGERKRVEGLVQVVAMLRVELAVEQQVAESLTWHNDTVRRRFEEGYVRRSSLQHRDEAKQGNGMDVADPVVLRAGQGGSRRRRDALEHLFTREAEKFEVVEHP